MVYFTAFRNHRRRVLCQFRVGSHWLRVQLGRFERLPHESRHCMHESNDVDDEMHIIFDCPHYTVYTLHGDCIESKYLQSCSSERESACMSS